MTSKRSTKRALISSALSTVMCAAMLIGSTFAWFTDTASTAVNKIQSGKFDIDIVDDAGNTLDGKTLSFKDVNGNADILWEPGATFNLDSFKIVNKGNLALKYKVIINGVDGDNKLLDVIDFTVKKGDAQAVKLTNWEGILLPSGKTPAAENEEVGETDLITITGTMRSDAGNQYQNLTIDGIGITVAAAQYTYESDSNGKTYDENAAYGYPYSVEQTAIIQKQLDNATDGTVIQLAPNTRYGTLYFRQSELSSLYTDKVIEGNNGNNVNDNGYIGVGEGRRDALYLRTIKNVTIVGAEGSVVENIEFMTGNYTYSADTEGSVSGNTIYQFDPSIGGGELNALRSYFNIENLTIKNVTFGGTKTAMVLDILRPNAENPSAISQRYAIDGLHFDGCKMTTSKASSDNPICLLKVGKTTDSHINDGIDPRFKNVSITNCIVTGAQYVFNGCGIEGFTATGNTFKNSGYCDIVFNGSPDQSCAGNVTITGNTSEGAYKYFLRIGDGSQMSLTVSGNTVSGLRADGATAVKVGSTVYTEY